ncbi:reverse transcriptase domain-containing protein [Tanacetum coccineum]
MLERLAGNEYYCFLDGFSGYFQIPIDPRDQEKTTFTCPYGTFAYRRMPFGLCNAPGTFQRCMLAIFHDMVEKTMEVFMDDFSVFGNSFQNCLSRLDHMLQRCEDTNLSLNWEKSHFMVKEGIVLGHKISKKGIELLYERSGELAADASVRLEYRMKNVNDPKEINESDVCTAMKLLRFLSCQNGPTGHHGATLSQKIFDSVSSAHHLLKMPSICQELWLVPTSRKTSQRDEMPHKSNPRTACHLPIELEHKAYWALKQANFDPVITGDPGSFTLNELNELRDHAYENL